MENRELITSLRSQSTWRLVGFGIITYGVYLAYYIKTQTAILNKRLERDMMISKSFTDGFMVLSYVSLILFIPYFLVPEGHPLEIVSNVVDLVWGVVLLIWGFKARNRLNRLCQLRSDTREWLNGFWTFLFTPFYFNYKINKLSDVVAEQESGHVRK